MNEFEFVFTLFGLLLGLSLVEVVSGLVRAVKVRATTRLGWLTPLLGLFVMLDLTSFWTNAWEFRALVDVQFAILALGMGFTAAYYFAASLVFPQQPETCPDLDTWYFAHKRQVLGVVLALQAFLFVILLPTTPRLLSPIALAITIPYFTLLITAVFAKGRRANAAALAGLSLIYVIVAMLPWILPPIFRALSA